MTADVGNSELFEGVRALAERARQAAPRLAAATPAQRDEALHGMARALRANLGALLEANARDLDAAAERGLEPAFIDRLRLDEARVGKMADAILEVAALPSPLGGIEDMTVRPNGLRVGRMRIPLGVIAIIYEARPNVTSDAASLCMKAGNAVILKGGRDARHSNEAIAALLRQAMRDAGLPEDAVQYFGSSDRAEMAAMLELEEHIDLVIPRGGEALIRFVSEHSRIPVLKHYKGVCHVYVDAGADLEMAVRIIENAKVQRPSVCNAAETLLVHRAAAAEALPAIGRRLVELGVTLHGCDETRRLLTEADVPCEPASEDDYHAEYLSLDLAVRVVDDMQQAMEHIRRYGSDHTEAIVTSDYQRAMAFLAGVDSSTVLVNASTRFADGGELGLGAEVGISTSRLHSYGPMGLLDLTARKFVVFGEGQVRT